MTLKVGLGGLEKSCHTFSDLTLILNQKKGKIVVKKVKALLFFKHSQ